MALYEREFGFYPRNLDLDIGPAKVRCLSGWKDRVEAVLSDVAVVDGWIYAPPQPTKNMLTGKVRGQPYSSRVFGLPKTHVVEYPEGTSQDHLDFLIWSLSFLVGMRLTATDAGFLDATPVKAGKLVDFVPVGEALGRGMELAERFWLCNRTTPRNAKRYQAAIHALFLGQNPRSLEFETFIYLYSALDACYALARSLCNPKANHRHDERVEWLCEEFGLVVPDWARRSKSGAHRGSEVSWIRNSTVHEALFVDAPLGFATRHDHGCMMLEMSALVCRLLVALVGGVGNYVGSSLDSRQRYGLELA